MSHTKLQPGEFPYPLRHGPDESQYLTWLRNHSNYMAERGLLDYVSIASSLVRGILINFLTVLPLLLLGALLLASVYQPVLHDWQSQWAAERLRQDETDSASAAGSDSCGQFFLLCTVRDASWAKSVQDSAGTTAPFLLTPWVAAVVALWFVLYPMIIRIYRVATQRKSVETGNESSVKLRDTFDQTYAIGLVIVFGAAVIEILPLLVHGFHQLRGLDFGYRELAAAAASAASVVSLSAAGKVLSALSESKILRSIAVVVIGLAGLLLPLLVILYVAEFLVYEGGEFRDRWIVLAVVPALLTAGTVVALVVGLVKKGLKKRGWLLGLLGMVLLVWGVLLVIQWFNLVDQARFFVLSLAILLWLFSFLAVDINLTSVHGLYRDRLAAAYLLGENDKGNVDVEEDLDLREICQYKNGSTAPYHIVNAALNLQGSRDMSIRERNSDFFIFSKRFVGGDRTTYCRSEDLESVFPQMDLATAMAISAAAASPNMGRLTTSPLVMLMTLFNIRLGYWIPNPGRLSDPEVKKPPFKRHFRRKEEQRRKLAGWSFDEVFPVELEEIRARWNMAYADDSERELASTTAPSAEHQLVGIGFSGGGIRSATLNLGIAQALHARGVFKHIDYMSTVSGGGYLGSSISTLMRKSAPLSPFAGTVRIGEAGGGVRSIRVTSRENSQEFRDYRIPAKLNLRVENGAEVEKGEPLVALHNVETEHATLKSRFDWRVRPSMFLREMRSAVDEKHYWVNLSDGGHLENLAAIELLRRRCKYIIIGDGEADQDLHFPSLATLIRFARLDLGIGIDIDLSKLRPREGRSERQFTLGTIAYPGGQRGYLLYLKSAFTGKEDEVVVEYRARRPEFPHESTADQFFDEGQFEAYRTLGEFIATSALEHAPQSDAFSFADLRAWFERLSELDSP